MWARRAMDDAALSEVSNAIHDAWFDGDQVRHDQAEGTLIVPFQQEGWPSGPPPDRRLVRESWRVREYRVAFFHGLLTVRRVRGVAWPRGWADTAMLLEVGFAPNTSQVTVHAAGARLRVVVDALDVEVVVSGEVAGWVRRRVGKHTGIRADAPRS